MNGERRSYLEKLKERRLRMAGKQRRKEGVDGEIKR
jgi:hypothetical protein